MNTNDNMTTDTIDDDLSRSKIPEYVPDESAFGSAEQPDYTSESTDYTTSSILTELKSTPKAPGYVNLNDFGRVDYLYMDERKSRGEHGWGEKACYNTGLTYAAGLFVGGAWGLAEGLRAPVGNATKLRLNAILNGCTRRGPLLGNSAGVLALMFTSVDHALSKVRGEDDMLNHTVAAGTAGMMFKSTAGLKVAARTGAVFAGLGAVASGAYSLYNSN
jgi:import inner membrane translocase subunit TIM23